MPTGIRVRAVQTPSHGSILRPPGQTAELQVGQDDMLGEVAHSLLAREVLMVDAFENGHQEANAVGDELQIGSR